MLGMLFSCFCNKSYFSQTKPSHQVLIWKPQCVVLCSGKLCGRFPTVGAEIRVSFASESRSCVSKKKTKASGVELLLLGNVGLDFQKMCTGIYPLTSKCWSSVLTFQKRGAISQEALFGFPKGVVLKFVFLLLRNPPLFSTQKSIMADNDHFSYLGGLALSNLFSVCAIGCVWCVLSGAMMGGLQAIFTQSLVRLGQFSGSKAKPLTSSPFSH